MALTNRFRVYCETESGLQYFDSALESPAEVCPNNASHTVRTGSLTQLGTDPEKAVCRIIGAALAASPSIVLDYDDVLGTIAAAAQSNSTVQKVEVAKIGSLIGTRKRINFIEGDNIVLTIADDSGDDEVDVTIGVDGAVPLNFRGGYDAATNTPDLDTSPSGVSIGDTYVVTVAGTFFTQAVEIGDVLIAEINNPTVLGDWVIISKNYDFGNSAGQIPDIATTLAASSIVETNASSQLVTATKQTGYNLPKATTAEINAGTEAGKLIPPDQLAGSKYLDQSGSKLSATASGTDTYTATISPAITAYTSTQRFFIRFTNANTGAATLNLNSLGAKSIVKNGSTALASGDIAAGQIYALAYDGTNFQIIGKIGGAGGSLYTPVIYPVWNTSGATLGGNSDTFAVLGGGPATVTATEANAQIRMPAGRVRGISGRNSGGNSDCTFTINKNGVATTVTGTQLTGTGRFYITGSPATFADGDLLSLRLVTTSGSGFTFSGLQIHYEPAEIS